MIAQLKILTTYQKVPIGTEPINQEFNEIKIKEIKEESQKNKEKS